ncbi:MAG: hypothetical protein V4702_03835 [Patescibacteria group bacterium]
MAEELSGASRPGLSLMGEEGQLVTRNLVGIVLGLTTVEELGDDRYFYDEGGLTLRVNRSSLDIFQKPGNDSDPQP